MSHKPIFFALACLVLFAVVLSVFEQQESMFFNFPGVIIVFGGTFIITMLSHSFDLVFSMPPRLVEKLTHPVNQVDEEEAIILSVVENYRAGRMRAAENDMDRLPEGIFKYGTQLILDFTPREDIPRLLKWRGGALSESENRDVQILRTMAGYAPAFGMLGTLFGLVQMLTGLGDDGLDHLGQTMGFAMMTTVYGLVAANLIFKPLAIKLELRAKQTQVWQNTQLELVLMLYERTHPKVIREYMRSVTGRSAPGAPELPALKLVNV